MFASLIAALPSLADAAGPAMVVAALIAVAVCEAVG